MQEYTVEEIVELVEGLPVLKIGAGGSPAGETEEIAALADAYEGVLELVEAIPQKARYGALASAGIARPVEDGAALYLPVANNCTLGAGVRVSQNGAADFAVGPVAVQGTPQGTRHGKAGALVTHFAARAAIVHALSGRGDLSVALAAVPDPAENGAGNTRHAATPKTVAAPDASGSPFKDVVPEEDEAREEGAGKGDRDDSDVDRDDVAADGLSQPEGGVRYLGVRAAAVAEEVPARTTPGEYLYTEGGVSPDWQERLSCLVLSGRFPEGVVGDVMRLIEALGDDARPETFVHQLADRRALLTGEDLTTLSRLDREGVLPADGLPEDRARRLAEGRRARLRLVGGELLLVSTDPESSEHGLVTCAARLARERRKAREADAAFRLSESVRAAVAASRTHTATLGAFVSRILPLCGDRAVALQELRRLAQGGLLKTARVRDEVYLSAGPTTRDVLRAAARLRDRVEADSRANKAATARLRRAGRKGLSARLADAGAPEDEVRFWRAFELKDNGEFTAAFAAPVVPFGGTPVGPEERAEILRLERARAAARDAGRVSAEVAVGGEWGFRLFRFGRTVCARLTLLSRHARVFRTAGAAHCWPVSETTVLYDPEGTFDAQLAEEVVAGSARSALKAPGRGGAKPDWPDRLPEAERESGPEPEGSFARRGRDPFSAERKGEAVIATRSGKVLEPSLRPRQRERARRRVSGLVERARARRGTQAAEEAGRETGGETAGDAGMKATRSPARALLDHLASLPVAERLELFLALQGPQEISVLKERADDPTGLFLAACELRRTGRITVEGGRMIAPPLTAEAKRELDRTLLAQAQPETQTAADVA